MRGKGNVSVCRGHELANVLYFALHLVRLNRFMDPVISFFVSLIIPEMTIVFDVATMPLRFQKLMFEKCHDVYTSRRTWTAGLTFLVRPRRELKPESHTNGMNAKTTQPRIHIFTAPEI